MVYSPGVVFRDDAGKYIPPLQLDVLTSAAVNAGDVRKAASSRKIDPAEVEFHIERHMRERMGRILCLFEQQGVKNLVLGSFGTGAFQNNREMVAAIWADLLSVPYARFKNSFDHVMFAITGKDTFDAARNTFYLRAATGKEFN
jgi:uncharacterized protein (TIGR02452 family)